MKRATCFWNSLVVLVLFFLSLGGIQTAKAEMQPAIKRQLGVPPITVLKTILQANQSSAKTQASKPIGEQTPPAITWLADSDAAISPQFILADPEGKLYSIRTLGLQMEASQESVDYGVLELLTPVLLITGNTGNQAIKLLMMGAEQSTPTLGRTIESLKKSLRVEQQDNNTDSPTFEDRLLENIETNIDYQVNAAIKRYQERIKAGRLLVAGGVIDLHNQYGRGPGRLIITNINGEGNDFCLRQLPVMRQLDPETLTLTIGRNRTGKENERGPCRN